MRNRVWDGGRPSAVAVQAEAAHHPLLLSPRGMVVREQGKGAGATRSGVTHKIEHEQTADDVSLGIK